MPTDLEASVRAASPSTHGQVAVKREPAQGDLRGFLIAAHRVAAGLPNLLEPLHLDVTAEHWPIDSADALVCNNMVHITPWRVTEGLMAGAGRTLRSGGIVYLYGPYRIDGRHTAASNKDFDAWLKAQNPEWEIRDLADVTALARRHGLHLTETVAMPANNLSVVFRRD